MKLSDPDDKMIPEQMLESDAFSDEIPEKKLSKDDISQRITNIVDQLHEICEDVRKALKQEKLDEITRVTQNTSSNSREEGACYVENKVFERKHEKNQIEKLITNSVASNQKLTVLPILGTGGVGKTTLARTVYNDPEIEAKFGLKIWIYVSANFDEVNLIREILGCISEGKHKNLTKNFCMLQDGVKKCLTKRFLLVLDDMWEYNETRWYKLLAPLRCTEITGNVILVTTRNLSVVKMTSTIEQHINLRGLEEDLFWLFFKRCIFGDENYQGRRKLQKIGKEIVAKLGGNPLAAKSVGTLLKRRLEEDYWQRISDGVEWTLLEGSDDIMPALMLSYNHLPYHLQRLFSYCALFPKGYKFQKEHLVHIWTALGLIINERKRLEDIGSDYFDDLVDRSFFEKFESEKYPYYLMHDLIHDVAQSVSVDECLTVDGSGPITVSSHVSHVSIWTESEYKRQQNGNVSRNETFEKGLTAIRKDEILRSLDSLMLVGAYDETFSTIFAKILKKLQYVRVLRLSAMPFSADILLSSISRLIHLRYLELKSTTDTLKPLPEALCRLYHLQVLDIINWSGLDRLPRGMSNLVNLRYLLVREPGPVHLHSKIARVGELKFLQELKEYRVQIESGFDISQLENLNEIRGSLRILNLENVIRKDGATRARIKDKKHLKTLSLSWGGTSGDPAFLMEVMEGLEPHDRLQHLHIINYIGATPSWLRQNFSLDNLESLYLHDCTGMETLPPFIEMPYLEKLSLVGMSSLKEVKFGSICGPASRGSGSSKYDMPEFEELALTELEISKCSALTSVGLLSCKALTKLSIKDCMVLASIDGLQSLDQLNYRDIKECPCLSSAACRTI